MLVLAALVLPAAAPVSAQQSSGDDDGITRQLAALNASLAGIQALLAELVEDQRTALLLARMEIARAELAPLEGELQTLRDRRRSTAEQQAQLQGELDDLARRVDGADDEQIEASELEIRRQTAYLELQQELVEERLRDLDRRILEVGNELSGRREELAAWRDSADQRLAPR